MMKSFFIFLFSIIAISAFAQEDEKVAPPDVYDAPNEINVDSSITDIGAMVDSISAIVDDITDSINQELTPAEEYRENYKPFSGFRIVVGGGISQINHTKFNTIALQNNFPQIRDGIFGTFSFGFMIKEKSDKLFFDFLATFIFSSNQKAQGYKLTQNSSSIDFNIDYALAQTPQHFFYTSLGIGWLGTDVIYSADLSSQSFGQTMATINGERTYKSRNNIYLNPKASYFYRIGNKKRAGIGISVGYRIGINNPKWKISNNQKLSDAPRSTANGFYMSANLTF